MQCLYRNRDDLLSLQPTKTSAEQSGQPQRRQEQEKDEPWCKCDRNCDDSNFFVQDLVSGQQSNNNNNFNFIIMLRSKKGTLRFTKIIMCVRVLRISCRSGLGIGSLAQTSSTASTTTRNCSYDETSCFALRIY